MHKCTVCSFIYLTESRSFNYSFSLENYEEIVQSEILNWANIYITGRKKCFLLRSKNKKKSWVASIKHNSIKGSSNIRHQLGRFFNHPHRMEMHGWCFECSSFILVETEVLCKPFLEVAFLFYWNGCVLKNWKRCIESFYEPQLVIVQTSDQT